MPQTFMHKAKQRCQEISLSTILYHQLNISHFHTMYNAVFHSVPYNIVFAVFPSTSNLNGTIDGAENDTDSLLMQYIHSLIGPKALHTTVEGPLYRNWHCLLDRSLPSSNHPVCLQICNYFGLLSSFSAENY